MTRRIAPLSRLYIVSAVPSQADNPGRDGLAGVAVVSQVIGVGGEVVAVQLRPKSLRSQPPLVAGSLVWPVHRREAGMPASTWLTCWPQPAQVVLPHFLQVTARHMMILLRGACVVRE